MKSFPIPVVAVGTGSQPEEEEELVYLEMPKDMDTYRAPRLDAFDDAELNAQVCATFVELRDAMNAQRVDGNPVRVDLTGKSAELIAGVNDALGEGEVAIMLSAPTMVRIQETAFPSIWRVLAYDEVGNLVEDAIEACTIPPRVISAARAVASVTIDAPSAPPGVMNSPALVHEILDVVGRRKENEQAHVLNLTLLPLSPNDIDHLGATLRMGSVTMLSRGYGNCRITSTALKDTWWVQYFNSTDKLILNTLEVVDVPEVALAAQEDWEASIERLGEWVAIMMEDY